jgi:tetratricopeptide (TPR) repeat protein
MNPATPDKGPEPVETGGDAMFCAVSPSGDHLAFISFRDDPSGNLFTLDLSDGTVRKLTHGPSIDMHPSWSDDGRILYFASIDADTNRDQRITVEDNPVIFRIRTDLPDAEPWPVTPYNMTALHPYGADNTLYFLSNYGGNPNCWALPETGPVLPAESADAQLSRARRIAGHVPYQPYVSLLAYYAVFHHFPENQHAGAMAGYAVGEIFEERGMPISADAAYHRIIEQFGDIEPQVSLAKIRRAAIAFDKSAESFSRANHARTLMDGAIAEIDHIAGNRRDMVAVEALFEKARILSTVSSRPEDVKQAVYFLDEISDHPAADHHNKARALFLAAGIYDQAGIPGQSASILGRIMRQYPLEPRWTVKAADAVIDKALAGLPADDLAARTRRLQQIAEQNREEAPVLTMSALNRIGDLHYEDGQWEIAKSAFRQVLDNHPLLSIQTAAARLALAEILFREERFRDALDLYEAEIAARPPQDAIFQMARSGYISKKIAAGEFHFRLGEVPTARNIFKELMDFDFRIIEAHRGYIKAAAAFGDMDRILAMYRSRLADRPDDPILLYAVALCLTYEDTVHANREAENLLRQAIRRNGRIEYFHQTLGYVCEVSETVYGRKNGVELALASYQKAFFLNDPRRNPENAANLALNLGNAFYLLGQYGKAFEFYTPPDDLCRRLRSFRHGTRLLQASGRMRLSNQRPGKNHRSVHLGGGADSTPNGSGRRLPGL